ncbi:MAG TPA: FtsX-like permease family protein, partial [Spirochaetota bacterium]|nr:FtsX-like permease family protein [Spirochaetota bacterium]
AVPPAQFGSVFDLRDYMVSGSYMHSNTRGVMISSAAVKELGAELGDVISVMTRTPYDTRQLLRLRVTGIFEVPDPRVQLHYLFIPYSLAEKQLQAEGRAGEIAFKTPDDRNQPYLSGMRQTVKTRLGSGYQFKTWQELGHDYFTLARTKKGGTRAIIFLIFIIVAVGIINTMLMAVFERVREIGMLRALGMHDGSIILTFILEAIGIGLIGSAAGIITGILLNVHLIYYGIDFSEQFAGVEFGYRTGMVFHGVWNVKMMFTALIFSTLCAALVSIIPARKAVRMPITTAVREV